MSPKSADVPLSLLHHAGSRVVDTHSPLLRGQVLEFAEPILPGVSVTSLYVALPAYLPDDFATFHDDAGSVMVAWLVPITTSEVAYVRTHGWSSFEDRLTEHDPDLIDLHRPSLEICE